MPDDKKSQLILNLSADMLPRMQAAAKMENLTLEGWVQKSLMVALPSQHAVDRDGRTVLEAAFSALDLSDSSQVLPLGAPAGVMPLPPESPTVATAAMAREKPTTQYFHDDHPCAYLIPVCVPNFKPDQVSGRCRAKNEAVCYWSSSAAKSCLDYAPKRVKIRAS